MPHLSNPNRLAVVASEEVLSHIWLASKPTGWYKLATILHYTGTKLQILTLIAGGNLFIDIKTLPCNESFYANIFVYFCLFEFKCNFFINN